MKRIAKFEKVSFAQFRDSLAEDYPDAPDKIKEMYANYRSGSDE